MPAKPVNARCCNAARHRLTACAARLVSPQLCRDRGPTAAVPRFWSCSITGTGGQQQRFVARGAGSCYAAVQKLQPATDVSHAAASGPSPDRHCSTHLMAYCRVFRVSSVDVGSGVMHAIMQVWALPPMESCRSVTWPHLWPCSLSGGSDVTLKAKHAASSQA